MGEGTIWLFGCGHMGGAMLRRWIDAGMDPARVTVINRSAVEVPAGISLVTAPPEGAFPDVLVLAVKPQQLDEAVAALGKRDARPPLVISVLAGVEEAVLRDRLGAHAVVRAMPNLPVSIGKGVVALYMASNDAGVRAAAEALAVPLGHVEWIADEKLFDVVTALSGSGPGFIFRFTDALARAGAALGLPHDQALRLAVATMEGSALLAAGSDQPPGVLADQVASPGGSTREGMKLLDKDETLVRLLTETLAASAARNAELAAAAR